MSPAGVIRAHWGAIAAGNYASAFRLFTRQYRTANAAAWSRSLEQYRPKVAIATVRLVAGDRARAVVFVDVYTRDMGPKGNPRVCNHFIGNVVVVRQGRRWRYAPGVPGATFSRSPRLAASDPRCASLF